MKKLLIYLFILLLPFYTYAYSNYVIAGGSTLGIEVNSKGVVVVGYYAINGKYINKNLEIGDRILKVNGEEVDDTKELVELIDQYMNNNEVPITYLRNNKEYNTYLTLTLFDGTYKTGLYVKSNLLGIGTLTYIDPSTGVYGILGHGLTMSQTNNRIEIKNGYSYKANVIGFTRSVDGSPGSKNADIDKSSLFGSIDSNTKYGVFGKVEYENNDSLLEVASLDEVILGKAYIQTTNENNKISKYEIKILEIDKNNSDKNIFFEIVDKELIKMSGGIVQGMSGSPIIQNDKIIGAVTRVLVDDVEKGFGISIVTMLEEGDKIMNK